MTNRFVGPNSRRISKLVEKLKPLSNDDRLLINLGNINTCITDLDIIKDITHANLVHEVKNMVTFDEPDFITNDEDKVIVNKNELAKRYIPNGNNRSFFTQVGNPEDFQLPISGSYMSVNNISINYGYHPVAYAERNGDVTILKGVTNGLTYRITYSFLKFDNHGKPTNRNTDFEYKPAGLKFNEGEFVGYIYPTSNNHMLIEIHTDKPDEQIDNANLGKFKEYALVELNGTLDYRYHKVTRLGTIISGINTKIANGHVWANRIIRANGIIIQEHKGKIYLIVEDNSAISTKVVGHRAIKIFELNLVNERLEPSVDWIVTNPLGKTYTAYSGNTTNELNSYILFDKLYSDDATDIDAWAYVRAGHDLVVGSLANGNMNISGGKYDSLTGKRQMFIYGYHSIRYLTGSKPSVDHKQGYFLTIDFNNKRIYSVNNNQREEIKYYDGNKWHNLKEPVFKMLSHGHHWVTSRYFQQLQNGNIMNFFYNHTKHFIYQYKDSGVADYENINSYTDTKQFSSNWISPEPFGIRNDSAVVSLGNNWLTFRASQGILDIHLSPDWQTTFVQNTIPAARKQTKTISAPYTPDKEILSEEIPGQRTKVAKPLSNFVTVVKAGFNKDIINRYPNNTEFIKTAYHFHSVGFTKDRTEHESFNSQLNQQAEFIGKTVKLSSGVIEKINSLMLLKPNNLEAKYSEDSYSYWWLVPGISHFTDIGFLRLARRWSVPNPRMVVNDYSGLYDVVYFFKTKTVTEGDVITITDIEFLKEPSNHLELFKKISTSVNLTCLPSVNIVFEIKNDNEISVYYKTRQGNWATLGAGNEYYHLRRADLIKTSDSWDYSFDHVVNTSLQGGAISYNNRHGLIISTPALNNTASFIYKRIDGSNEFDLDNPILVSYTTPKDGFSVSINEEIEIYNNGGYFKITPRIIDFSNITALGYGKKYFEDFPNSTLHMHVFLLKKDFIRFDFSYNIDGRYDNQNSIYLGSIRNGEYGVIETDFKPVTRYNATRPSHVQIGSAFPVSTGFPFEAGYIDWDTGTLRRPKGQYNIDGTKLYGVAKGADWVVLQTPLNKNAPLLGNINTDDVQIVRVNKAAGDTFEFDLRSDPHDNGWVVQLRSLLGDPNTGFTMMSKPREVEAPLLPRIRSVKWVKLSGSDYISIDEVDADTEIYLEIIASGLSKVEEPYEVTVDWSRVNLELSEIKNPLPNTATLTYSDNLRRYWIKRIPVEFIRV